MSPDPAEETTIDVEAFQAQCPALIGQLENGNIKRVILTKHDRPVAAMVPIEPHFPGLWGAMRGTVKVAPGTDLTEPTREVWQADT